MTIHSLGALAILFKTAEISWPPVEASIVTLGVVVLGVFLFYVGYGWQRRAGMIGESAAAPATIDKLFTEGTWFSGSCFATVSFSDSAGVRHQSTVGVMRKAWVHLREGGKINITYSVANPQLALAGRSQGMFTLFGWAFMVAGTGISLLVLYNLVACSLGWGGASWSGA